MEKSGWRFASAAMRQRHRPPRPCKRCVASARRRSCQSSLFVGEDFSDEFFESRISAQRIENRIDFDFKREPVAFFDGLCKPGEGLLLVTQPQIGSDVLNGWDVL